jgi:hypothetical protein
LKSYKFMKFYYAVQKLLSVLFKRKCACTFTKDTHIFTLFCFFGMLSILREKHQ